MLDDFLGSAAVVKNGILKQVNQPFIDLLGYKSDMLLEKNLLDFIVSEGNTDIKKYFSKKSKDRVTSTYETTFLTKDNQKIPVNIFIKPTVYNKEKADLVIVRNL